MRHCKGRTGVVRDLWEMRHELDEYINNSKNPIEIDRTGVILSLSGGEGSSYTFGVKKIKKNRPIGNPSYGSDDEESERGDSWLFESSRNDEESESDDSDYSELEWLLKDQKSPPVIDTR